MASGLLRAPAFPVSRVAWQRSGHVRPGAADFGGSRAGGPAPMPARSPGPSFGGASHREMWKLPVYLRPAFLCCLPHPTSQQKLPRGFWPLGPSWMEPVLAGVELVFILWEQPVVLRSASPHQWPWSASPSGVPSPAPCPDRAAGIRVRWPCPGQKSRTPRGFSELLDPEWWETPGSEGAG